MGRHKSLLVAFGLFLSAMVGGFLVPYARADVVNQFDGSTYIGSNGGNTLWYLGTAPSSGSFTSLTVLAQSTTSAATTFTARVTCFDSPTVLTDSTCSVHGSQSATAGFLVSNQRTYLTFTWTSMPLQAGRAYLVEVFSTSGNGLWGSPAYQFAGQCQLAGSGSTYCTGTPYFAVNSSIDWNAIATSTVPLVFDPNAAAVAASSSLWGAFATTTTLAAQCNSGNLLGDGLCLAGNFLFVPNPNVLNSFAQFPQQQAGHFPFSWIVAMQSAFASETASSTKNMATLSINLHDLGIGSTTPMGNILPNFQVLSTTTVLTYLTQSQWDVLQLMISAGIWLAFAADVYYTSLHRFRPAHTV